MDSPSPPPSSGFSALEKAELDELRLDKDRLLRNCDDLRQERSRLNSEVQELRNQNAQLIEDHTRDMLSIKAKETQLVRARSEAEAADAMCAQLRREMERLKRALTAAERAGTGPVSPVGERSVSGGGRSVSGESDEAGIYRDTGMYGGGAQEGRRTPGYGGGGGGRGYGEEKENGFESPGAGMRKLRSPELLTRGLSRTGSSSSGRSPAREAFRSGREGSNPSPAPGDGQPVESWKRAAEVTSALKAKIEQMKARQGISRP
ncbi:hypothetical protein O988_09679 [Pseudogymnoascus sp. VKM F-3808]|nr:hypothetical protein O988_09679 [Pseudogymnoascus sp. VKM F-3808]KFY39166.1 hypothetical protein V495_06109 [Pseudogymnoascus sp. VKM F-4514 (FW-929)]